MSVLPISRIKPGMKLEQAVYLPDGKCLLTAGAVITNRNIEKFREFGILEVDVADIYTLFISPSDKTLVEGFVSKAFCEGVKPPSPQAVRPKRRNKQSTILKIRFFIKCFLLLNSNNFSYKCYNKRTELLNKNYKHDKQEYDNCHTKYC